MINAAAAPSKNGWQGAYHLVATPAELSAFVTRLAQQRRFAFDLETTHPEPRRADIVGLAFSWQPGEAWYVALRAPAGEPALTVTDALAALRPLLESCVAICRSCGDECERHAKMHAHCRVCAEACRRCEQACQALLDALR